jgi:hypothetical protein
MLITGLPGKLLIFFVLKAFIFNPIPPEWFGKCFDRDRLLKHTWTKAGKPTFLCIELNIQIIE